jgi:Domain of unknown function DUF29
VRRGAGGGTRRGGSRVSTLLYERDFDAWVQHQARALRAQDWDDVDWPHLLEEIEDLPQTGRDIVRGKSVGLLAHLLKLKYQPTRQSGSWRDSVREARAVIAALVEKRPSLRRELEDLFRAAYPKARRWAIAETKLPPRIFPADCEWSADQVLDEEFWP